MSFKPLTYTLNIDTPFGKMHFCGTDRNITGLCFGESGEDNPAPILHEGKRQLEEYFDGKRKVFDLPIELNGTEFQKKVWNTLCDIPYGKTATYGEIAEKIGSPKAYRAVGMANNRNPIAIIVPCHRVIGKNGSLTGYAGGINIKEKLIELENK